MKAISFVCQLKSTSLFASTLLLLLLVSCSSGKNPATKLEAMNWSPHRSKQEWFDTRELYAVRDKRDQIQPHLFFDLGPLLNSDRQNMNFVAVTPAGSRAEYQLNLKSGQLYKTHHYCEQNDVWRKYKGKLTWPNYTRGFVPRVLDATGQPQQVIVFGRDAFYREEHGAASHRIRVVGSVNLQYCALAPCNLIDSWQTRQLLVAVDPVDSNLKNVFSIHQLEQKVNWKYAMAFLQNGSGSNRFDNRSYAAYRVTAQRDVHASYQQMAKESRIFKPEEMQSLRQSCEKLYDFSWRLLGPTKESIKRSSSFQNFNFAKRFKTFHQKFGEQFNTCTHFVSYHNLLKNRQAHWLFAHIEIFYKLRELGYIYMCKEHTWLFNPEYTTGKNLRRIEEQIMDCSAENLEQAFPSAISFLGHIKNSGVEHYRFIEWDSSSYGSKERLYSWVKVTGKKMRCYDPKIFIKNRDYHIFPKDVDWAYLHNYKTLEERKRVIE